MDQNNNKINAEIQAIIKDMSFIIKKTHKIGVATSVLSKCLLETDPFRNSLRDASNSLLTYTATFHKKGPLDKEILFGRIEETLTLLERQLFTLWSSADISEQNYGLLKNTITSVLSDLKNNQLAFGEDSMRLAEVGPSSRVFFDEKWIKGEEKDSRKIARRDVSSINDREEKLSENVKLYKENEPTKRHLSEDKSERIDKILGFIKDKGDISVKDIMSVIEGVATKTIQRDLQFLIDKGQVKKTGKKRWARYVYIR